jgi:hypothetical protein
MAAVKKVMEFMDEPLFIAKPFSWQRNFSGQPKWPEKALCLDE